MVASQSLTAATLRHSEARAGLRIPTIGEGRYSRRAPMCTGPGELGGRMKRPFAVSCAWPAWSVLKG